MDLQERVASIPGVDSITRFAQLERVLAAILMLTPALLVVVDVGPEQVRDSVSAYHDIGRPETFFVPLTVAAMLFIVNGVLKDGHWYNWVLGILLLMVVVFDHDGVSKVPHNFGALGFFGGNVATMVWFSKNKSGLLKAVLAGTIALAVVLWLLVDWFTLFWAEWVSLVIVALHYILDSVGWTDYRALTDRDAAELVPATTPPPPEGSAA